MNDSKAIEILIALRGAPESLFGMMLDIVRRCISVNGSEWQKLFQSVIDNGLCTEPTLLATTPENTITVLPALTFSDRIALGKYDWKNSDIADSLFPHSPTTIGEWEYDLYHPNCSISSEDAKSSAEVDGWHDAEAEHLLAFGAAFPDVQRKFPVIALGSVCEVDGFRYVPALWNDYGKRYLGLNRWVGKWGSDYRFLRVRKVKPLVA